MVGCHAKKVKRVVSSSRFGILRMLSWVRISGELVVGVSLKREMVPVLETVAHVPGDAPACPFGWKWRSKTAEG